VAEVLDQVEHEPEVLEQLTAFILAGNLAGVTDILSHLRDLFTLIAVLLRLVKVAPEANA
jgi:hypothetical protein